MNDNYKVLATITSYNPDMELLEKNIDAVINQVDKLLVYENCSDNRQDVVDLCKAKGVEVVLNDKNYGVAGPLHDGIEYAYENGYEYIFTLDQDSVAGDGMIKKLASILLSNDKIAMVCGTRINPDFPAESLPEDYCAQVGSVITSGTLASVKAVKAVGNYMPEMFIDAVDNEICYRLKKYGYCIYSSGARYMHFVGKPVEYKVLFKTFRSLNYSPFRLYYIGRNYQLLSRIYKHDDDIKDLLKFGRHMKYKIILVEKNKLEKLKAIRRGKKDAKQFYKELKEKYSFL